ncbi:sigma-70 family RNA polymerase sigma factor [Alkalibacillus almallahensis]|uniref:sigma-70 family RNA polymerase sigma factor n=1 Tax=Alkalibacillus almallahensis TaxID=1379154 RepID=UPI0014244D60|nr:sigma-70 family RNA polymerase sigma factor [Alkalibacillus almallahensis]NIK11179.1 transposase-like protein [Alkalibacillus almallahensis]
MNLKTIENMISDYHWMIREVDRLAQVLWGSTQHRSEGVSQYGLASVMPNGSPGKSQVELDAMDRQDRKRYERYVRFKQMTSAVEHDIELLDDEFLRTIYDCMMEGMSYRAIGMHLGIARRTLYNKKYTILHTLHTLDQSSQIIHFLQSQKNAV